MRPRDFQELMNSHNWIHERPFGLVEAAPHIWVPQGRNVPITALAAACVPSATIGLESALWAMRVRAEEPDPVQLVLPRGSRVSRRHSPAMQFHWSDAADDDAVELRLAGIKLRVHSPARALIDIIRLRTPDLWPTVADDLSWARSAHLVDDEQLLRLASKLRALQPVSAWLAARKGVASVAAPPPPA